MLSYLVTQSKGLLVSAGAASVTAGVFGVLLLAQINRALTAETPFNVEAGMVFAALAIGAMLSRTLASILFERLGQYSLAELRRYISSRVLVTDFKHLESIGSARIQSALSEHSTNVAQFFVSVPAILTNAVIVLGCLVYMALLSWQIFLAAIVTIGLGSVGYHLAHLRAIRFLDTAASEQDRLFGHFRALVDGAKELRLNRAKRERFKQDILGNSIETVRSNRTVGMSIFVASASWGNFLIYAFIGLVLFVLVGNIPDRAHIMTGFALVFLYMITPLEVLLLNIPRANLAKTAANRIEEITRELPLQMSEKNSVFPPFKRLTLSEVTHRYFHEQQNEFFKVGPINLEFQVGTITFLVGGNGSGKTTLAKLLAGLYVPESGQILLDNQPVDDASRDEYRQVFSAIFSDYHLFEELLEIKHTNVDSEGNALLSRLHLAHKVQVKNGAFTTRALSQGQRKRLALIVACLEDRQFLIFDEWAADQDPVFKNIFYTEILPELKARGKTVLVISHDDRYFHLADNLLYLENGALVNKGTCNKQGAKVSEMVCES